MPDLALAAKIKASCVINERGCWVWQGAKRARLYGEIWVRGKHYVHRVAWEVFRGPIPLNLFVCHHCDNPPCCNPDHLFLGTNLDNIRDRHAKGRSGWRHGTLTGEQIAEIRSNPEALLQRELGSRFGVGQGTISRIMAGKTYRGLRRSR